MIRSLSRRLAALLALALTTAGLLAGPAHASTSSPSWTPVLTGAQQRTVLDLIDDVCGDTWCEGDARFDFRTFTCDRQQVSCTLGARLAPYTDGPTRWYWRSGTLSGFPRFRSMVSTSPTGARSLTPAFYDAVNVLVNAFEESLPGGDRAVPHRA